MALMRGEMSEDNHYSPEEINARARAKKREDFADLQDEMAGRITGKNARFLSAKERSRRAGKNTDHKESLSRLQIMLADAAYYAAYEQTMSDLSGAESTVYDALIEAADQVNQAQSDLDDTVADAQTLPDGTKVFRSADGSVYTVDGRKLDDDVAAAIDWKDGAPTWEDVQAKQRALEEAKQRHAKLAGYDAELARIRKQMEDEDNPPTQEEIDAYKKRIAEIESEVSKTQDIETGLKTSKPEDAVVHDLALGPSPT